MSRRSSIIRVSVSFDRRWMIFHRVSNENSTSTFWKKLEGLYKRKITGNKNFLIRKINNIKLKGGCVNYYTDKTQRIMS